MSACGFKPALLGAVATGASVDLGALLDRCDGCRSWLGEVRTRAAALDGGGALDCDGAELVLASLDLDEANLDDVARLYAHLIDCEPCRETAGDEVDDWLHAHPHRSAGLAAPPTVVPRSAYERLEEIGRGGMGRVWRGRDLRLGRDVAVKEMLAGPGGWHSQRALRARFEREARLTARLEHPSIVGVHEAGEWSTGEPFYAMRLVSGEPLAALIRDTPSARERLALLPHLIDAAEAIAFAHSRRICHRDLKPANILVGSFGETVVIDWGLARDLGEPAPPDLDSGPYRRAGDQLTMHGQVLGTPAYMAPEQARGEAATERFDVYALGAILYHLLAGQPPYGDRPPAGAPATAANGHRVTHVAWPSPTPPTAERGPAEMVGHVLAGPPTPLRQLAPGAPEELLAIAAKAMARNPADRYPSAKPLADDLRRYQAGQLVSAHRYSPLALVGRWLRRRRVPVAVAAGLVAVMVVGGFLGVARIVRERDRAEAASAEARARNHQLILAHAERALDHDPTETLNWLAQLPLDEPEQVARARRLAATAVTLGVAERVAPGTGAPVDQIAVAADGSRIATADPNGALYLWDPNTLEPTPLEHGAGTPIWHLDFSPDGTQLAIAGATALELHDLTTGTRRPLPAATAPVYTVSFLPDGQTVIASGEDGAVRRIDTRTGTAEVLAQFDQGANAIYEPASGLVSVWTMGSTVAAIDPDQEPGRATILRVELPDGARDAEISPDGAWLAGISVRGDIAIWELNEGTRRDLGRAPSANRIAISTDGSSILAAAGSQAAWRVDVASGVLVHLSDVSPNGYDLARSANGWIVFAGADGTVRGWHPTEHQEVTLQGHEPGLMAAVLLPDERLVSFSAAQVRRWSLSRAAHRVYRGHDEIVVHAAYRRDGALLTIGRDGSLRDWSRGGAVLADGISGGARRMATKAGVIGVAAHLAACITLIGGQTHVLGPSGTCTRGLEVAPDGTRLAATSTDFITRSWTVEAEHAVVEQHLERSGSYDVAIAFVDSQRLRAATATQVVEWLLPTGALTVLASASASVRRAYWAPDGRAVVLQTTDGAALWREGAGHTKPLDALPTGEEARYIATTSGAHVLAWAGAIAWLTVPEHDLTWSLTLTAPVTDAAAAADGGVVALATRDRVEMWWPDRGRRVEVRTGGAWIHQIVGDHDGTRFAATTTDGVVVEWRIPEPLPDDLETWLQHLHTATAFSLKTT